jgi:hypothetical protein
MEGRGQIGPSVEGVADVRPAQDQGRLVTRRVDELRMHPTLVRHHLTVSISKLSAIAARGAIAFREPLVINQDKTILDGYVRWEWARMQGRETLPCIEYELGEEEVLQLLLQSHRRSNGLNDFGRILLALDLEPFLQQKARSNQQSGGQHKGWSKLTEAHVRTGIAAAAGVSTGNVTKVKHLLTAAHSHILQAVRAGEISIHRAWLWSSESPQKQCDYLRHHKGEKGVRKTIRQLVARHRPKNSLPALGLDELVRCLSAVDTAEPTQITVGVLAIPGKGVFMTEELFRTLNSQRELTLKCATNNR